jgi:hypothetical protein
MLWKVTSPVETGTTAAVSEEDAPEAGSAVLRVHRRDNPWRDWMIAYAVEVDGQIVGAVMRGLSFDCPLQAGEHHIRLRTIGSWSNKPSRLYSSKRRCFWAEPGDLVEVICGPNGPAIMSVLAFFQFHRYIKIETPHRFRLY